MTPALLCDLQTTAGRVVATFTIALVLSVALLQSGVRAAADLPAGESRSQGSASRSVGGRYSVSGLEVGHGGSTLPARPWSLITSRAAAACPGGASPTSPYCAGKRAAPVAVTARAGAPGSADLPVPSSSKHVPVARSHLPLEGRPRSGWGTPQHPPSGKQHYRCRNGCTRAPASMPWRIRPSLRLLPGRRHSSDGSDSQAPASRGMRRSLQAAGAAVTGGTSVSSTNITGSFSVNTTTVTTVAAAPPAPPPPPPPSKEEAAVVGAAAGAVAGAQAGAVAGAVAASGGGRGSGAGGSGSSSGGLSGGFVGGGGGLGGVGINSGVGSGRASAAGAISGSGNVDPSWNLQGGSASPTAPLPDSWVAGFAGNPTGSAAGAGAASGSLGLPLPFSPSPGSVSGAVSASGAASVPVPVSLVGAQAPPPPPPPMDSTVMSGTVTVNSSGVVEYQNRPGNAG